MEIITVTSENLEKEHICCAISKNDDIQVASKKAWLKERFADGLVFLKGNVRGKCFIEYIPAEKAWAPVVADGYMYIDCLWVSGQFKEQGNATLLLDACIADSKAKGKAGLVTLSSPKKEAFLADAQFLQHKGFQLADEAAGHYQLYYLPFTTDARKPSFCSQVGNHCPYGTGFVITYTHQCPFTAKYVPLLEEVAKSQNVPLITIRYQSAEEAQHSVTPFTTFNLFYNGKLLTHEIQSEKRFLKMITERIPQ